MHRKHVTCHFDRCSDWQCR